MDQGPGIHCTKMGADSSAENTPNVSINFRPICPPKPKSLEFLEKNSLWVSVVIESRHLFNVALTPRDTSYPDLYDCTNCVIHNIWWNKKYIHCKYIQ